MSIESILSITGSLIAIGTVVVACYEILKKKSLTQLMTELADKNTPVKRQHKILHKISRRLKLSSQSISSSYIKNFHSNGRSKLAIFYDICNENDIEPTPEICIRLIGSDEKKFRNEWIARHLITDTTAKNHTDTSVESKADTKTKDIKKVAKVELPKSTASEGSNTETVYLSELLAEIYPDTCKRLTDILNSHNIPFAFLKGTKDIWCRDYMPVQTPDGKLIQFKYDPSYLKDPQYSDSRSDVKHVDEINGFHPIFSDINLDGGNVVMFGNKAIMTDRIFSENPDRDKEKLIDELSSLLKCEIVIIPSYKPEYDYTGHADGMIRFVDRDTVLVNNLDQDFKYMREAIVKALEKANLKYINFPWFEHKIKGNYDHAIGIYINYLEVGNLIVLPVFGVSGNKDAEALAKLKEVFPDKVIETIDYNDVAMTGGLLNCSTWVVKK